VSRRWEWVVITLILLLAAALRFWALGETPPGLCHDEVANWLIARDILSGHHAIYFTAAYGHEPLYQYVQAATVALFGDHWLGLRWPSVAFGLLGIAVIYVLIRRLFDAPVALLTAAWLASSFWPLFYARVGWRAIALPFTAALSAYFLLRSTNLRMPNSRIPNPRTPRNRGFADSGFVNSVLAGAALGLSLYTYMAARILPFILVAFLIYSFLIRFHQMRELWPCILLMLAVAALVSAPLVIWLATHPGAEYRIVEVREPLDRLLAGDPSLVWQNLIANLKFFTFAGDPWPHQNLPGRPVFTDPVSTVLSYAGLLVALWRWRDPCYGFLLIWLVGALVPSAVTSVAPSSIRDILGLVVIFAFPALALVEAGRWVKQRMQDTRCRIAITHLLLPVSCFLLLAPCLFLTLRDYFVLWPQNDVVRFDYQTDLTAVAHRLDELSPGTPVAVAGLSVHTMDGPSLDLTARRDVHDVRLCDTRETLVVPAGRDVWLFVPRVVPFDVDLQERLLEWGAVAEAGSQSSFTYYRLSDDTALRRGLRRLKTTAALPDGTPITLPVSFGGRVAFLGYERLLPPRGGIRGRSPASGDSLTLLTYWRVEEPPSTPLKAFVHLLGESDARITQHDGLGSPLRGWSAGDLIVQKHVLPLPASLPPGLYTLRVGLYNAPAGPRLSVADSDWLLLPAVEVDVQ
jgi:4-amino-4-deoxy-L-arabinose transferase-like glycosyltransferase